MIRVPEKAQAIMDAEIVSSYYYGKEDGKMEGKQEGKAEVAISLLEEGLSVEVISRVTGMPVEKILRRPKQ